MGNSITIKQRAKERGSSMQDLRIKGQEKENVRKNDFRNKEALRRVAAFMQEDDETFFRRTIRGLTDSEIEEFLEECPEFRPYWKGGKTEEKG